MTTLLEKLRPEIFKVLEYNREQYDYNITDIYNTLDTKHLYSELTIAEMKDLTLYADVSFWDWDSTAFRYGTKLFKQDEFQTSFPL
jgi:hypothetical protein